MAAPIGHNDPDDRKVRKNCSPPADDCFDALDGVVARLFGAGDCLSSADAGCVDVPDGVGGDCGGNSQRRYCKSNSGSSLCWLIADWARNCAGWRIGLDCLSPIG